MLDNEPYFIYLDQEAYDEYNARTIELKQQLYEIRQNRDSRSKDPDMEELRVSSEIQRRTHNLSRIKIVRREEKEGLVNLNDVVTVLMIYSAEDIEEESIMLVAGEADLEGDILKISINSPLGNAIYGKKIGDTCSYTINGRTISVIIKGEPEFKQEDNMKLSKVFDNQD